MVVRSLSINPSFLQIIFFDTVLKSFLLSHPHTTSLASRSPAPRNIKDCTKVKSSVLHFVQTSNGDCERRLESAVNTFE